MPTSELLEKIRAFIAINLPTELLAGFGELQEQLQSGLPKEAVRWATQPQMHLTLKFLGNIATADASDLKASLQEICAETPRLLLRAETLGCFPSASRPRVIWMGLGGDIEALQALQSKIDAATRAWCERDEQRAFRPHVTIGRVREVSPRLARQIGVRLKGAPSGTMGEWTVKQVHFMRSKLSPRGVEHTIIASWPLLG